MQNKVLLHACCAICAGYPIEFLLEKGFVPVIYFCNPNIFPKEEYERRFRELYRYTQKKEIVLIEDRTENIIWYNYIKGLENEPEKGKRCTKCFEYRLNSTVKKALELGISKFTTTLTISPHKNSKVIFETAKEAAKNGELEFLEYDFKKLDGFKKTMKIAKEENFYRQNYCGCEFSIRKNNRS